MPIQDDISPPVGDKVSPTSKFTPEMSNMKSNEPEGVARIMLQSVSPINEAPQPSTSFSASYKNVPGGAVMNKSLADVFAELNAEELGFEPPDMYNPIGPSENVKAKYDQLLGDLYDALQAEEKSFSKFIAEMKDQQEKSGETDFEEDIKKCEILQEELLKRLQESKYGQSENTDEVFMKKRINELYFMKSAMKKFSEENN